MCLGRHIAVAPEAKLVGLQYSVARRVYIIFIYIPMLSSFSLEKGELGTSEHGDQTVRTAVILCTTSLQSSQASVTCLLSVRQVVPEMKNISLLQIPEVIKFCCDFLMSWVDEENILDVYRLADHYDLRHLSDQLDSYILKNFAAFSRTQVYRQLPLQKVYSLLSSNRLEVNYEFEVYDGALFYHYSPEQLETDQVSLMEPLKLLETVRFPLMEPQILQRLHDKLSPCPLKDTVADALMYHKNECLQPMLQSSQTQLRSEFQCVVGFGGMHSTPSIVLSDQAKYLNPLLGEWRHFTAALAPRMSNQGIAVLNNFVYLIGGDNNVSGFRAESRCWR